MKVFIPSPSNASGIAPILQPQRIAQGLDTLVVCDISGDKRQLERNRTRGNKWIGISDRLADAMQIPEDAPSSYSCHQVQSENLMLSRVDLRHEFGDPIIALLTAKAINDFANGDDRQREMTKDVEIGVRFGTNGLIASPHYLGKHVRIEERTLHIHLLVKSDALLVEPQRSGTALVDSLHDAIHQFWLIRKQSDNALCRRDAILRRRRGSLEFLIQQ